MRSSVALRPGRHPRRGARGSRRGIPPLRPRLPGPRGGRQRYAGGAYPAFAPDQLTHYGPLLRSTYGRVLMAGADRSERPGTMEGAVRDGNRAAQWIIDHS
ncbi:FAD-dependent oxidoreductase [Micrococcus sp. FDAARGOS_333]|uniref:FAD-dependent oxidoreductase n=1 Tax=Micrococcus sp. FDAARGOS_333 TaxID=1930558 RepID=UPI00187D4DAE